MSNIHRAAKSYRCARRVALRMLAEARREGHSRGFRRGVVSMVLDKRAAYMAAIQADNS